MVEHPAPSPLRDTVVSLAARLARADDARAAVYGTGAAEARGTRVPPAQPAVAPQPTQSDGGAAGEPSGRWWGAGAGRRSETTAPTGTPPPPPGPSPVSSTPPAGVLRDVRADVIAALGADLTEGRLADHDVRNRAAGVAEAAVAVRLPAAGADARQALVATVLDDILGLGPLEPLLRDPGISEIMVNGYGTVYAERMGLLEPAGVAFADEGHLRRTIDRIVARVGRRIDEAAPMVDARLEDGSRVNAVLAPIALDGSSLTIRKFTADAMSLDDLVSRDSMTADVAAFLAMCVAAGLNILVSGGTGSGKTTLLGALSAHIPPGERIITIEDAAELRLDHNHLVRLESRPPSAGGGGEITIRDLLRNALRMRPDRIIVGEVRDGAALDMLQAMNTGHDGSLGTVHASSVRDALRRLETMVLFAGFDLPIRAIRDQIGSGVDLVVHLDRLASGARQVVDVSEVVGLEGEIVTVQSLFVREGADRSLVATGFEPRFWPRIRHLAPHFLPSQPDDASTVR